MSAIKKNTSYSKHIHVYLMVLMPRQLTLSALNFIQFNSAEYKTIILPIPQTELTLNQQFLMI